MHPNYKPNSKPVIDNSDQQSVEQAASQNTTERLDGIIRAVQNVIQQILESPILTELIKNNMEHLIEPTAKAGSQKRKTVEPTNPAKRVKLCDSSLKNQEQSQLDNKEPESESVREQTDIKRNQDQCTDVCCRF